MSTVTLSDKGRIVLPIEVRKALGLDKGVQMDVLLEGSQVVLRVVRGKPLKAGTGYGLAKGKGKARGEDDGEVIGRAMKGKHAFD